MKRSRKLLMALILLVAGVWGVASIFDIATKELVKSFCSTVLASVTMILIYDFYLERNRVS